MTVKLHTTQKIINSSTRTVPVVVCWPRAVSKRIQNVSFLVTPRHAEKRTVARRDAMTAATGEVMMTAAPVTM